MPAWLVDFHRIVSNNLHFKSDSRTSSNGPGRKQSSVLITLGSVANSLLQNKHFTLTSTKHKCINLFSSHIKKQGKYLHRKFLYWSWIQRQNLGFYHLSWANFKFKFWHSLQLIIFNCHLTATQWQHVIIKAISDSSSQASLGKF